MDYTLTQLRGFVTVAEELHYGRAAERLQMTQPPLTRQVQALERALRVRLLDRGGREVALTAAGAAFYAEARRVLALVEAAPDTARRVAAGDVGTMRLGFTSIGAYAVLGEVITQVADRLPGVQIALREEVSEVQCEALANGQLDIGLVRPPVSHGLRSTTLHVEDLVIAIPRSHELADSATPVSLADIADGYIGYSPEGEPYLHTVCAALVGVAGFLQGQIASQVPTMLALVRAGRGFALVPRSCTAMRVEGVVYRELAERDRRSVALHLAWSDESINPIVGRFVRLLRPELPWSTVE